MSWWYWVIVGLAALGIELFTPGGFFMFLIGVAAIVTGVPGILGLELPFSGQVLLFSALSVLLLLTCRKPLQEMLMRKGPEVSDEFSGKEVLISEEIAAGAFGKGEFRGSNWNVRNLSDSPLKAGCRVIIDHAEGLNLIIR